MDERRAVTELIDRLVREAGLPDPAGRDALRRELESHFEDAGTAPEALPAALERFGSAGVVARGFRRAYRRGRRALYALKVAASLLLSVALAVLIQLAVSLAVPHGDGRLVLVADPRLAAFTAGIVVVLVAAWELDVEPLCRRLERRPLRLLALLAAFAGTMLLCHAAADEALIPPGRALLASGVAVMVWTATVAITARLDAAYVSHFAPPGS